ncbi:MAG: hypothetical protein HYX59_16125 [Elusimicrobia bacterium]|nr:hypothetical protein [Elusimicrobiota bacterium]
MNKHVIFAVLEIVALFGTPVAAMAGGWALRRRYRERDPRLAYHAGTVLLGGGALVMLWVLALVFMMRHW